MSKHDKVEGMKTGAEEEQKIRYRVKCNVCRKSITTDLDPSEFKKFKCSKCGAVGKFEFTIVKKKEKKLPRYLSEDEVFTMFQKSKRRSKRDLKVLKLLYYFGLRNDEMVSLRIEDINLNKLLLKVILGKGKKDRFIPILEINPFPQTDKTIVDDLRSWIGKEKEGFVITGGSEKGTLSNRHVRRIVKKYAKLAKIRDWEEVHPHTLRHSYATHLRNMGVPIEVIQKLLGHIRLDTTMIYAHMGVENVRNEVEKIIRLQKMKKDCVEIVKNIKKEKNLQKKTILYLDLISKQNMILLGIPT